MKTVIVGAGAIGRLFGALLRKGGHEVIFIEPDPETVEAINQNGVGFMTEDAQSPDSLVFYPAQAVQDGRTVTDCDLVILAVKSFDTISATKSIAHLASETSPVLSIQTGLGIFEIMEKLIPREFILQGFTFMAATALGPGVVRHGGYGKTYLGEIDGSVTPRIEKINQTFNESGIKSQVVHRIIGRRSENRWPNSDLCSRTGIV